MESDARKPLLTPRTASVLFIHLGSDTLNLVADPDSLSVSTLVGRIGWILRFGCEADRIGPPSLPQYLVKASAVNEVESLSLTPRIVRFLNTQ